MRLAITKIHGCENDYLFLDCLERPLADPPQVARRLSHRRRGIGSDGLILVCPSDVADFRMEMYNADGSRGEMCGNGIRGFGKFVHDHGLLGAARHSITVETDAGIRLLELHEKGDRIVRVTVDMGEAVLDGRSIPVAADGRVVDRRLEVDGRIWNVTCVSMGNPHCVTFDADPDSLELAAVGPHFEHHAFFPARANTEFVRVESPTRLVMRVWERGSGETMACGTGACAAVVAGVLTDRCARRATVVLRGGELEIEYQASGKVVMTGPVEECFSSAVDVDLPV